MDLEEIQRLIRQDRYEISFHAQQERLEEDLDITEIETAILSQAEIIEQYPEDPRGESCLILGYAGTNPIHIVAGWARGRRKTRKALRLITVYMPTLPKWADPRTRGVRP